jgi:hypothetical protein
MVPIPISRVRFRACQQVRDDSLTDSAKNFPVPTVEEEIDQIINLIKFFILLPSLFFSSTQCGILDKYHFTRLFPIL